MPSEVLDFTLRKLSSADFNICFVVFSGDDSSVLPKHVFIRNDKNILKNAADDIVTQHTKDQNSSVVM